MSPSAAPCTLDERSERTFGSEPALAEVRPQVRAIPCETRLTVSQQGRPPRGESLRRKAMFLSLVASGVDVLQAAKDAHVKPERALKIISTADEFQAAVAAIRAGAGPLAVVVAEPKAQAA